MANQVKVTVDPKTGKQYVKRVKEPIVIFQGRAMLQSEKLEILDQKQIR